MNPRPLEPFLNVLVLIPARGGSKGIPGKNLKRLAGKPLIAHAIEQALRFKLKTQNSKLKTRVVVSTDDEKITAVAKKYGAEVPFMRPKSLAGDKTPMVDVVLHALKTLFSLSPPHPALSRQGGGKKGEDACHAVVVLQPTSPFRRWKDVDGCLRLLVNSEFDSVISVREAQENPGCVLKLHGKRAIPLIPDEFYSFKGRQYLREYYVENGAVYACRVSRFLKHYKKYGLQGKCIGAYVMTGERSLDIDTKEDFEIARKKWKLMG